MRARRRPRQLLRGAALRKLQPGLVPLPYSWRQGGARVRRLRACKNRQRVRGSFRGRRHAPRRPPLSARRRRLCLASPRPSAVSLVDCNPLQQLSPPESHMSAAVELASSCVLPPVVDAGERHCVPDAGRMLRSERLKDAPAPLLQQSPYQATPVLGGASITHHHAAGLHIPDETAPDEVSRV